MKYFKFVGRIFILTSFCKIMFKHSITSKELVILFNFIVRYTTKVLGQLCHIVFLLNRCEFVAMYLNKSSLKRCSYNNVYVSLSTSISRQHPSESELNKNTGNSVMIILNKHQAVCLISDNEFGLSYQMYSLAIRSSIDDNADSFRPQNHTRRCVVNFSGRCLNDV